MVILFTCITEARQAVRAIAVAPPTDLQDASDDALRRWLAAAPPVGKLT